jgi:hypothetical protein
MQHPAVIVSPFTLGRPSVNGFYQLKVGDFAMVCAMSLRTTLSFAIVLFGFITAVAQTNRSMIIGTVTDSAQALLPGATVQLDPGGLSTTADSSGQFTFANVAPGTYTVRVSYVGFSSSSTPVTVTAGKVSRVTAVLNVASESESVLVTAERAHGEAESINEERVADNILNVLPAEVITSLPNKNIADALGRLPGVTLERDEGEGKYVQIRGTEPRLANLTIDGVEVPSPEGGVRQVKLDVIPADLVDSVQINKTLQPNMNGDAIGGSVNLVTRKAEDRPNLSLYGLGGFTPIANTRSVYEFGGTAGKRFGPANSWALSAAAPTITTGAASTTSSQSQTRSHRLAQLFTTSRRSLSVSISMIGSAMGLEPAPITGSLIPPTSTYTRCSLILRTTVIGSSTY